MLTQREAVTFLCDAAKNTQLVYLRSSPLEQNNLLIMSSLLWE